MATKGDLMMVRKAFKYSASVAVLAALMQTTPAFASPIDNQKQETQKQIDATKGQIDDFETKVQQLDDQISMAMDKSQQLNDHIKSQKAKIKKTMDEIDKAKADLEAHKKVYSERLKSIQAQGDQPVVAYAELLFSSDNISEFLTRFTAISDFLQNDTDLLNGLKDKQQALTDAEEKLHNELDNLQKSQNELADEQKSIESNKQEILKELANAKNNLKNQQGQLAQIKAAEQALLAQQQAEQLKQQQQAQLAKQKDEAQSKAKAKVQQSAPSVQKTVQSEQKSSQTEQKVTQSVPKHSVEKSTSVAAPAVKPAASSTGNVSELISYAKQFLGVPYQWGGTTPNGFDCSGFVQYVYRSIGINLPRVSHDQQDVGTRISPSQVQPGDLVFRGNPAYHVGIYIGGGKFIHAPQTGDVVKIATYNPAKFTTAARIINN